MNFQYFLLLVLITPVIVKGQGWKIDQPHKYIIVNGEYIQIPVEDKDTEDSSILSKLNPMNAFQNFWSSLPSLNFLSGGTGAEGSETSDDAEIMKEVPVPLMEAQESSPMGISTGFPSFASGVTDMFASSFLKRNSPASPVSSPTGQSQLPPHFRTKRNAKLLTGGKHHRFLFPKITKPPGDTKKKVEEGRVRYIYYPLGQGSYYRYEVPILSKEEIAAAEKEKAKKSKKSSGHDAADAHHAHMIKLNQETYQMHSKSDDNGGSEEDGDSTDPFPCPKVGQWKYDGTYCTATQAIPPWSCKPIDIATSGKLTICRNKVYY